MKESQNIEFKTSWRDEYLKWICGYANADGGILYIGKDDNGNVVGLTHIKKLLEDIPNKVRDILGIMVDVNLKSDEGEEYLEVVVDPYPYPVSFKGEYHYRSGSTKQELKGAALDRFLLRKQGRHWDGVPVPYVRLADFDNKIMFWNPGTLPDGWTVKTLTEKHASQPHNPDIANALFRAGMIEAWGRGIEKISQACLESGASRFEIQHEPNGLWLIFFFSGGKSSGKTTVETTVETPDAIVRLMAEKPDITLAEVAAHIGKSVRTIERAAAKLKKEGKITFKGPKKGGRWEILV